MSRGGSDVWSDASSGNFLAVSDVRVSAGAPVVRATVTLTVNGEVHRVDIDTRTSLLDLLRERLDLTGTKRGCDHGQCGACTVLLDGRRANSCLALAIAHDGADLRTIEGLADADKLHPVQQAFVTHDALQCGYCTPGQICSAVGMLDEIANGWPSAVTPNLAGDSARIDTNAEEIRERLSGNLCRCGAYVNIVAAVLEAGS
jgi:xanthine dehydrogenase YagT iron-sulfur-binding subunit